MWPNTLKENGVSSSNCYSYPHFTPDQQNTENLGTPTLSSILGSLVLPNLMVVSLLSQNLLRMVDVACLIFIFYLTLYR